MTPVYISNLMLKETKICFKFNFHYKFLQSNFYTKRNNRLQFFFLKYIL